MPIELDPEKYPAHFFYMFILYIIILVWSLSLSYQAYAFFESQLLLLVMILPAILFAIYIRTSLHNRALRIIISVLSVISMIISVIMGYIFFG
ncbi:MAG: hypothetical protein HYW25_06015 [Candidatus Aenigmarchaeota archaeon]|nr:hypothetical protein [Candidatus Aenigmarchaeota archaeon]